MLKQISVAVAVALVVPVATGCSFVGLGRDRLLVWHDWPEPEASVLTELLRNYEDVDPDLELIVEYVPADRIESRFATEVASGFGPDVLIGADAARLADLVAEDAVHRITTEQIAEHRFHDLDERAMDAMAIGGDQRGIPLTGFTDVLYYRDGVTPPSTLDEIIDLAEDGYSTAIPLDFEAAFWGIDAFDGAVFDPTGDVAPDDGFTAWMAWLVEARPHPNIILDGEYELLRDLFADGKIDLFVGGSREIGTFRTLLRRDDGLGFRTDPGEPGAPSGEADGTVRTPTSIDTTRPTLTNVDDPAFGLTTLPAGINEAPGGLLDIEGMIVNRHTDRLGRSLELMEYLTNIPSQGRIARSGVGRIPINQAVSIDPTISPIEAALVSQQQRAVALPEGVEAHRQELELVANEIYLQVTRGLLEPSRAALAFAAGYRRAKEASDE